MPKLNINTDRIPVSGSIAGRPVDPNILRPQEMATERFLGAIGSVGNSFDKVFQQRIQKLEAEQEKLDEQKRVGEIYGARRESDIGFQEILSSLDYNSPDVMQDFEKSSSTLFDSIIKNHSGEESDFTIRQEFENKKNGMFLTIKETQQENQRRFNEEVAIKNFNGYVADGDLEGAVASLRDSVKVGSLKADKALKLEQTAVVTVPYTNATHRIDANPSAYKEIIDDTPGLNRDTRRQALEYGRRKFAFEVSETINQEYATVTETIASPNYDMEAELNRLEQVGEDLDGAASREIANLRDLVRNDNISRKKEEERIIEKQKKAVADAEKKLEEFIVEEVNINLDILEAQMSAGERIDENGNTHVYSVDDAIKDLTDIRSANMNDKNRNAWNTLWKRAQDLRTGKETERSRIQKELIGAGNKEINRIFGPYIKSVNNFLLNEVSKLEETEEESGVKPVHFVFPAFATYKLIGELFKKEKTNTLDKYREISAPFSDLRKRIKARVMESEKPPTVTEINEMVNQELPFFIDKLIEADALEAIRENMKLNVED